MFVLFFPPVPPDLGGAGAEGGTVSLGLSPDLQPPTRHSGVATFLFPTAVLLSTFPPHRALTSAPSLHRLPHVGPLSPLFLSEISPDVVYSAMSLDLPINPSLSSGSKNLKLVAPRRAGKGTDSGTAQVGATSGH